MYVRFLSDMPTARRGANQECREDEDLSRSKTIFGGEQHACGNVERGSFGGSHSSHSLWRMTARTMHMRKRKLIRARKLIRRDARVYFMFNFYCATRTYTYVNCVQYKHTNLMLMHAHQCSVRTAHAVKTEPKYDMREG